MRGDIGVQHQARGVFHDHQDVEQAKGCRDHNAKVTGHNRLGMVADKGPSVLGWRAFPPTVISVPRQVFPDGAG
jgi:hypothetical protein